MDPNGKVALVTGGGSGIGRATSIALAQAGASVVVADVNEDGGRETVRMIEEGDGKAAFVKTDVTKRDEIERDGGLRRGDVRGTGYRLQQRRDRDAAAAFPGRQRRRIGRRPSS